MHGTPMIRIGPTKLCKVLASVASHENSVYPISGNSTVLPKVRMRPVIASVTQTIGHDQCANAPSARSARSCVAGLSACASGRATGRTRRGRARRREQEPAPEQERHAPRTPGLTLGLDEDVRFPSPDGRELRLAGADFLPQRLVVERLRALARLLLRLVGLPSRPPATARPREPPRMQAPTRARRASDNCSAHPPSSSRQPIRLYSFWFCVRLRSRSHSACCR